MSHPDLRKLSARLASLVEARVVAIAEQEPDINRIGDLLGVVQAATEVTGGLIDLDAHIARSERDKDALRARLVDASRSDANRVKERMAALDGQIAALRAQQSSLLDNLAAIADVLGS